MWVEHDEESFGGTDLNQAEHDGSESDQKSGCNIPAAEMDSKQTAGPGSRPPMAPPGHESDQRRQHHNQNGERNYQRDDSVASSANSSRSVASSPLSVRRDPVAERRVESRGRRMPSCVPPF